MKKMITAALASIAALVVAVLVAPMAQAFVPPDPAGSSPSPSATIDSGVALLSWQTALVAVVAVVVGAAIALAIEHYVRRSHASGLVAA